MLRSIAAHWADTVYSLSAGQHAVLPEGKGCCHVFYKTQPILTKVGA